MSDQSQRNWIAKDDAERVAFTSDLHAAYLTASDKERKLFNQAVVERIEVDTEEITGIQLSYPFESLIDHDLKIPADKKEHRPRATSPNAAKIDLE